MIRVESSNGQRAVVGSFKMPFSVELSLSPYDFRSSWDIFKSSRVDLEIDAENNECVE